MSAGHLAELADAIAEQLAHPDDLPAALTGQPWWRQSLARGAPGVALLHVERAAAGRAPWRHARDWLAYTVRSDIAGGPESHLYYGAPAVAHVLACAATADPRHYRDVLSRLDRIIEQDVAHRLTQTRARIGRRHLATLAEFDVIRGLTGLGGYLLRRRSGGETLRGVLSYLVRLTEPVVDGDDILPGWWTLTDPSGKPSNRFAGGHANFGVAHGIGGPLALLALARRRGVVVDGQHEAISRICAWLDRWRVDADTGPVWPYWINRPQFRTGRLDISGGQVPSWCYGTAGLARAQQLAGIAAGDIQRRTLAEQALVQTLTRASGRAFHLGVSLCHGYAGLAHVAAVAGADAAPATATQLRGLAKRLLDLVHPPDADPEAAAGRLMAGPGGPELLDGAAGVALVAQTACATPVTGWNTCLFVASPPQP